ncbi:MAG: hypothetical protein ACFFB5_11030 [Promethearchaeota archaeon]
MIFHAKAISGKNTKVDSSMYILEEGDYITGYNATLVYVMSGLVKAVYVLGTFQKKKLEILSTNCQLASVPFFQLPSPIEDFENIKVLAVVGKSAE